MIALVTLTILALVALVAVVVWWSSLSLGADHLTERTRVEAEEQMAIWQLKAIRHQAEAEMRRLCEVQRSRTPSNREFPTPE